MIFHFDLDSSSETMAMQNGHNNASILDIRHGGFEHSILDDLREKLNPGKGQERRMPTLLLYDDQGLKLFEDITYLDEYYLTNAEIKVLQDHADRIASFIQPGSQVVELGSGYDEPASLPEPPLCSAPSKSKAYYLVPVVDTNPSTVICGK